MGVSGGYCFGFWCFRLEARGKIYGRKVPVSPRVGQIFGLYTIRNEVMIGQRFREKKRAVLDVWERYKKHKGTGEDGVDPVILEHRAKALEEGHYVLAVIGEAKAGKSTLINALLGERILPTDVLQSSSAIVEIFKSARSNGFCGHKRNPLMEEATKRFCSQLE
jgi:hypothetical protein